MRFDNDQPLSNFIFQRLFLMVVLDLRELKIYYRKILFRQIGFVEMKLCITFFLTTDMSQCLTPVMYTVHRIYLLTADTIFVLGISSVQIARENCAILFISGYAIPVVRRSKILLPKWNIGTYWNILFQAVQHSTIYPLWFHMRLFMLKSGYLCVI